MTTLAKRSESAQIIGGVSLVSGTLGLLIVANQITGLQLPEGVYFGLLWIGTFGGATLNGYRNGNIAVSCLAAGIGVFPMALAFAPSGPPEFQLTAVDILLKAGGATLLIGVTVGCISHGVGYAARRLRSE